MAKARKAQPSARLIQNSIYTDDGFLALNDPLIQLAYVAALGQIDNFGNLTARANKLRAWILPLHRLSDDTICAIFDTFVEVGLAFYYEVKSELYIHFFGTYNKLYEAPVYPLPEGLIAKKPDNGGRYTAWRVYDADLNECDADGDPLDGRKERVAPDYRCQKNELHMHCIYTAYLNRKKGKERIEENFPFLSFSLPEAGACLEGTPAPAEDILPSSEEQRQAFLDELTALKGDDHAE